MNEYLAALEPRPTTSPGTGVRVRWDERLVRMYHQGQLVRVHAMRHETGTWVTNSADRPAQKPAAGGHR